MAAKLTAVLILCLGSTVGVAYAAPLQQLQATSFSDSLQSINLKLLSSGGVDESLSCFACQVLAGALQDLFESKASEDEIAIVITDLCIALKLYDKNVCTLAVQEFKDEVLTIFGTVSFGAKEFCGYLVGPPCEEPYDPYNQEWNVTIPGNKPPVQPVNPPKDGSPVNRILHLSDFHYDSAYTPGLSNDCGEPLCCRPPNQNGSGPTAAGYWGDYNCDVPYQTLENMMQFIATMKDEFDWIYWTGDLPAHNVWNQSRTDQLSVLKTIVALSKQYLPDKKVYAAIGNHESAPVNSFPPPFITGERSNQWLLDALAEQWGSWLPADAQATIKKGGYYNAQVRDGLRVISLQTNYANDLNWWLLINDTDPAGQLQWLTEQLLAAEKKGDKVHIIGHIPPNGLTKAFGWNYHSIVNRFESTVVGQFFGHTHDDKFQIFFDEQDSTRPFSVAFEGPSVTTYGGKNPGIRVYDIDGDYNETTNALLNHQVYYLNLSDANLTNKPKWQLEYSAKETYGLTSLQPADWVDLVDRFKTDDALFQKFYQFIDRMSGSSSCDASCKAGAICGLLTSRTGDHSHCSDLDITETQMKLLEIRNRAC